MAQEEFTYSVPTSNGIAAHNVDLIVTYSPASLNNGYYTATAATGTYTVLNSGGSVDHVDNITGIGPVGGFGGNDNLFRIGTQPYVDNGGLNFAIDRPADTSAPGNGIINFYDQGGQPAEASVGFVQNLTQRAYVAPTPPPTTPPATNAPCYCVGTRILTDHGEVAVEALAVGDRIVTASGQCRPIRWIGSRCYPGLTAPKADCPVRIRAGAISNGVPALDLLVSPDHALLVEGLFVAAGHLVNGTSVTRGEAVADLTYWHIELDSHDLLLAENTPAESFLAAPGVRAGFNGVQALDAGPAPVPYAPRAELGPELAALRGRLARRALSSGEAADLGPVRAWLDRCVVGADGLLRVGGWAQDAAHPDAPVCLDVLVDGAVVAFTVASEYRADLAAAGIGDGWVGFDLGLDVRLAPGVPHVVEVRRSADGAVVCAKQVDAAGAWTALLAA